MLQTHFGKDIAVGEKGVPYRHKSITCYFLNQLQIPECGVSCQNGFANSPHFGRSRMCTYTDTNNLSFQPLPKEFDFFFQASLFYLVAVLIVRISDRK